MLDPRTAFKVGFLSRCVEEGLAFEAISARVKAAADALEALPAPGQEKAALFGLEKLVDLSKPVVDKVLGWGIPAALAAPPIAGGLTGYAAAKAFNTSDDVDSDEIKKRELIDEYRRQIAHLTRRREARALRAAQPQRDRVFL
jgi:hypothetical protein